MGDFDPAIAVAVALAVEEETDVPRRKHAKWSKEWFLQRSKFGHTKLLHELSQNELSDFKNFLGMDVEPYNKLKLQMVEPLKFLAIVSSRSIRIDLFFFTSSLV